MIQLFLRRGSTLIELLLYIAILGTVAASLLPLLYASSEDRLLQQTIATVEQSGQQLLQTIGHYVRHSERVVRPKQPGSGAVLTLQTGSGATNPTIIGSVSGTLILIQGTVKQVMSSSQVAVRDFTVWNTSTSAGRESVLVRFTLSRTIRLQAPRFYSKTFEAVFSLFPDDVTTGDSCGCAPPGCANDVYIWEVCVSGMCELIDTELGCP